LMQASRWVLIWRSQGKKKNLLGFRARASRISSLASGRGGPPRYCGGQQSGLKKRLSSPRHTHDPRPTPWSTVCGVHGVHGPRPTGHGPRRPAATAAAARGESRIAAKSTKLKSNKSVVRGTWYVVRTVRDARQAARFFCPPFSFSATASAWEIGRIGSLFPVFNTFFR
jgi:hypothetical protein